MKIYLVGGAVRDELLGTPVKDEDFVVVGGTPDYFLKNGYEQVGADFPVFLHPETKDEYALARKERKTGLGYGGFECDYDPSITLKDDLFRRDLTINALAKDPKTEKVIDYFGGMNDIKNKKLRHVSDHFREDPLRVLRIARFAARYKNYGFTIADDTQKMMCEMVKNGELNHLNAERIKLETDKAMLEDNPDEYFFILRECGALSVIFPEVENLFGVPQPEQHHPEIDTGIHTMLVLQQARQICKREDLNTNETLQVMWCSLTHDFGKAITPEEVLPQHINHEINGLDIIRDFSERLRLSKKEKQLSLTCCKLHTMLHGIKASSAKSIVNLLNRADYFRNPEMFKLMTFACEADSKGRTGLENRVYDQPEYLYSKIRFLDKIDQKSISEKVISKNNNPKELGTEISDAIRQARLSLVKLAISIDNDFDGFQKKYRFLKSLSNDSDKENLFSQGKQLFNNKDLLSVVLEELDIDVSSKHFSNVEKFIERVNKINPQLMIENGVRKEDMSKAIRDEKNIIFSDLFDNPEMKKKRKVNFLRNKSS